MIRNRAVALALLAAWTAGCATEWNEFSMKVENATGRPLDLHVRVLDPEFGTVGRTYRLGSGDLVSETWAVRVGSHRLQADAGALSYDESFRICASYGGELRVLEDEIAFHVSRGDGWAGC